MVVYELELDCKGFGERYQQLLDEQRVQLGLRKLDLTDRNCSDTIGNERRNHAAGTSTTQPRALALARTRLLPAAIPSRVHFPRSSDTTNGRHVSISHDEDRAFL